MQVEESSVRSTLASPSADHSDTWKQCKQNHARCNSSQIQFLKDFRNQMLDAIKVFFNIPSKWFVHNSCFAHCQLRNKKHGSLIILPV
ncbi:hypothetical protein NC652_006976 [Populus alba x Populus x berolinensis]|nr:hypothetical protein NC652_006976 [Populus alba x Populus x berolinensis]